MRRGSGTWKDPFFHLIACMAVVAAAVQVLESRRWERKRATRHPTSCHACAACSSEVAAARDLYLFSRGFIDEAELGK